MSKIIVFGAGGQLGQCLRELANQRNIQDIYFPTETEADILNVEALKQVFDQQKPEYCINCAAYTAVDKAEDEKDLAEKVNKTGAENLAKLCNEYQSTLIHVSTDFVFEGNTPKLLTETDVTFPINVYGETKLAGEKDILLNTTRYFILRTSWLYSEYGNNFVKTMLRLGAEKDELKVIADQIGTPTYAMDLAAVIFDIIESGSNKYGVYHYSNEGVTSWYDFAKAIFDIAKVNIKVYPVPTSEYVTKAKRPAFSVMDKSAIKNAFQASIPYWRESLEKCIAKL
ncbi:dTDP-4-dehydrorhamnose reductase [Pedobacter sp. HMF7647]|uniref:dTDP-4-dehydrorhamnose reductase n=1 Tax=Hufsiella arboris TaxID=2695275 RepID=A0A7K1YAT5_9SPHI|nr:dTDP-4-dehydrorhamnose reductase [Hufsiella arboris]MXV51692.1 dTDP-4-dehydrorhamnose reductase [Hufsiella arboris]